MNKRPAFQFYPADWRKDPQLQMCDMATQGMWINILCCMWEADEEGKLEGTHRDICRLLGISLAKVKRFCEQAKRYKFADVTECNGKVTIINRRMYSVFLERERAKKGMREHREKKRYKDVTTHSSSSTSSSNKYIAIFEKVREKYYGSKRGCETEFTDFRKKHNDWRVALPFLLVAIEAQISQRAADKLRGEFVPPPKNFKTWINQRCWEETSPVATKERTTVVCANPACGKKGNWTLCVSNQKFCSIVCREKVLGW